VRAVSKKRARLRRAEDRPAVRAAVFERYGYRCQLAYLGGCFGRLTPHHRQKEGQGGPYTEANLVALCAHHNDELEADADLAELGRDLGLVVRSHEPTPTEPWEPR
jgi:hypothetical protein